MQTQDALVEGKKARHYILTKYMYKNIEGIRYTSVPSLKWLPLRLSPSEYLIFMLYINDIRPNYEAHNMIGRELKSGQLIIC